MLNFLYCFDNAYNTQAQCSIYSILENVDEKINIHIIHKTQDSERFLQDSIKEHKKLNSIKVYKFSSKNEIFPNLDGAHISEATYYRLHIDKYLDKDIDFVTYLDSDIICYQNPIPLLKEEIKNLRNSEFTISACIEKDVVDSQTRLSKSSNRYFNAGVLLINFRNWKNNNIGKELLEQLKNETRILEFWDQDLLNIYFDDNFLELNNFLNYKLTLRDHQKIKNEELVKSISPQMIFIHYSGKFKPWSLKGIINKKCVFYQDVYRNLFSTPFHLSYNYKLNTLKDLFRSLYSFTIFQVDRPFSLLKLVIKSLLSENKKY
jgi:lipopolysaccharide biosynthesis glycosyltransferase